MYSLIFYYYNIVLRFCSTQVVICNSIEELHQYLDKSELNSDLSGDLPYHHEEWIQQRIVSS